MSSTYFYRPEQIEYLQSIIQRVQGGEAIAVEIVDDNCLAGCDGYLENGMRAVIKSVAFDSSTSDKQDRVYIFTLDFSDYVEFNRGKETSSYQTSEGLLTATQVGYVPTGFVESTHFSITHSLPFFRELNLISKRFYSEYQASGFANYTSWLENELAKARGLPAESVSVGRVQFPAMEMIAHNHMSSKNGIS